LKSGCIIRAEIDTSQMSFFRLLLC